MDAVDISNNTPRFTVDHVRQWHDLGVGLGVVQLIGGVRLAGDDCATQIRTLLAGGLAVDCYLFPENDGLSLSTAQRLALVPPECQARIRQLWIDDELPNSMATESRVQAECDAWAQWQKTGRYSALWFASQMGWLPWPWPNRKQWLVSVFNDGHPNLGGQFAGTNTHVMTQYHEDIVLAGIGGMDISRLTDTEEQAVLTWLAGDLPAIPVAEEPMAIKVGEGMAKRMVDNGDAPLCDHVNYKQTDDDGIVYEVERCQGAKGFYVSSNAGGTWVNAGPL